MSSTEVMDRAPSPGEVEYWRGLFKVGGLLMLLSGVLVIVDLLVGSFVGGEAIGLNLTTEQLLQYIAAHRTLYMFDETLLALAGVPMLASGPALALALYFSLKEINRKYIYIIVFSLGVGVVGSALFLAAAGAPLALVPLADKYTAATSDAQRAIFVTAAEAVNALDSDFLPFIIQSLGLIITSIAMRKSVFGKPLGYLGMLSGISGLLQIVLVSLILSLVWGMWVGFKLFKLGRSGFRWEKQQPPS